MKEENLYTPNSIRTYTQGNYLDFLNLKEENILIIDIAHALSLIPRFGGHTKYPYSVARHSINICKSLYEQGYDKEICFEGLMHDSSEAYLIDIPSPIKKLLPDYLKLEKNLMKLISKKFHFNFPLSEIVKKEDKKSLEEEWNELIIKEKDLSFNYLDDQETFIELYYRFKK